MRRGDSHVLERERAADLRSLARSQCIFSLLIIAQACARSKDESGAHSHCLRISARCVFFGRSDTSVVFSSISAIRCVEPT